MESTTSSKEQIEIVGLMKDYHFHVATSVAEVNCYLSEFIKCNILHFDFYVLTFSRNSFTLYGRD